MVSPLNPRKYMGPDVYLANIVVRNRRPTSADFRQPETGRLYPVFAGWAVGKDPTTGVEGELWLLTKIVANVAYWEQMTNGFPDGTVVTTTGDDGTPVSPDMDGNIDFLGFTSANGANSKPVYFYTDAANTQKLDVQLTTTVAPTPGDALDVGLASFNQNQFDVDPTSGMVSLIGGSVTPPLLTITGDDGVAVSPDGSGNIDLLGQVVANGTNPTPVYFESPGASIETLDVQIATAVTPTPGTPANVGLCCFNDTQFTVDPVSGMVSAIGSTGTDYHVARYIVSAGGAADGANYTTIASAITAAVSAGGTQTIAIQPGTYTENLTLPANINLTAFPCDAQTPSVIILGTITSTDAGTRTISNVRLQTNGGPCISITGSAATNVKIYGCTFNASNAFAIVGSSSGNGTVWLENCGGGASGANSMFQLTNGTNIVGINCRFTGTTTSSTLGSGCDLGFIRVKCFHPITTSGTSTFGASYCDITSTATSLVLAGSGSHSLSFSSIGGPSAVTAITVASTCNLYLTNCQISGITPNVITGAGTVNFSCLSFVDTGNTITVTNQNLQNMSNFAAKVTIPGAYPYTILAQDYFVPVTTTSARTIRLPSAPTSGEEHVVKDNTGSAAANNITVQGNGNNIDGAATKTINTNYGAVSFTYNGTQWNAW